MAWQKRAKTFVAHRPARHRPLTHRSPPSLRLRTFQHLISCRATRLRRRLVQAIQSYRCRLCSFRRPTMTATPSHHSTRFACLLSMPAVKPLRARRLQQKYGARLPAHLQKHDPPLLRRDYEQAPQSASRVAHRVHRLRTTKPPAPRSRRAPPRREPLAVYHQTSCARFWQRRSERGKVRARQGWRRRARDACARQRRN